MPSNRERGRETAAFEAELGQAITTNYYQHHQVSPPNAIEGPTQETDKNERELKPPWTCYVPRP